ncbi:hypothetical protein [Phytomonospora endophytica]|uniref:Uncharacterized protein n=1 Tax=Phytomonospora endophytica TaxID=714109 RepID=A0A841FT43_9ACTN|nr:hypothetical protein [Phytomonospora endophytica]MBB6038974.1 hypothetical protein [Phytomonospora endophytica]
MLRLFLGLFSRNRPLLTMFLSWVALFSKDPERRRRAERMFNRVTAPDLVPPQAAVAPGDAAGQEPP